MKNQAGQVAALPIRKGRDGVEVLLVTSRETGRWVIPKGWRSKKLSDWEAARREARQEAGVRGPIDPDVIGAYTYLKRMPERQRFVTVDVFLMLVEKENAKWPEADERRRAWFTPLAAARQVREPGLKRLLQRLGTATRAVAFGALHAKAERDRRRAMPAANPRRAQRA